MHSWLKKCITSVALGIIVLNGLMFLALGEVFFGILTIGVGLAMAGIYWEEIDEQYKKNGK